MDIMPGYLSRMIFYRFDLSLPVFRGSKGRIWMKLSLQQLRRPLHIHTPLVSANAVNIWSMECIWISYRCAFWIERLYVCIGGEAFFANRDFDSYFSLESSAVGLAAGQGSSVCMHPSRSLGAVPGPHRIHCFLA